jgi:hypothetical protein
LAQAAHTRQQRLQRHDEGVFFAAH